MQSAHALAMASLIRRAFTVIGGCAVASSAYRQGPVAEPGMRTCIAGALVTVTPK